jgi:hypothetical protein
MSPVVGTRATRATAKTSSVLSLHLPDADRSAAVAAAGSHRWGVSSRCGRVAGFVSSGNSSASIILGPATRISRPPNPASHHRSSLRGQKPVIGLSSDDPGTRPLLFQGPPPGSWICSWCIRNILICKNIQSLLMSLTAFPFALVRGFGAWSFCDPGRLWVAIVGRIIYPTLRAHT